MRIRRSLKSLTLAALLVSLAAMGATFLGAVETYQDQPYREQTETWRKDREKALLADGGWLTVTGLFWLKPGVTTLGLAPGNDIVLPATAPPRLGTVDLSGGKTVFRSSAGVTLNGKPVRQSEVRPYGNGSTDALEYGPLQLLLVKRGERWGVRLKDRDSHLRKGFTGLRWYPVKEEWRVKARFLPSPEASIITFDTIIGDQQEVKSPGFAEFEADGQTLRLQAAAQGDKLFFVFRDQTSGKETYAASRFLYADAPRNGEVLLDFNRAQNPPCAFTPYATCPLPPPQNRLPVAIPAGELKYEGPHE